MVFDPQVHKSIIILDHQLSPGLAINAASVIGVNLGRSIKAMTGPDLYSQDQRLYPGVICAPLPVLTAAKAQLHHLHSITHDRAQFFTIPFSALAQSCKNYEEYTAKMMATPSQEIDIIALGLIGPKKEVIKLSGSFPLFR